MKLLDSIWNLNNPDEKQVIGPLMWLRAPSYISAASVSLNAWNVSVCKTWRYWPMSKQPCKTKGCKLCSGPLLNICLDLLSENNCWWKLTNKHKTFSGIKFKYQTCLRNCFQYNWNFTIFPQKHIESHYIVNVADARLPVLINEVIAKVQNLDVETLITKIFPIQQG